MKFVEKSITKKIILIAVVCTVFSSALFAARKVSPERQKLITYSLKFMGSSYVLGATEIGRAHV